jgi:hypothetical protein
MTLRQQQPVVAGVFNQTAPGFSPAAALRWSVTSWRCWPAAPAAATDCPVVGDNTQPQPHLVGLEAVGRKPHHRDRLLAFLDPLFCRATFVVEAHHRSQAYGAHSIHLPAIRVGDLLDTKQWGASQWPLLRVLNVEHAISENTAVGIDPAGRITHRVLVYTESVPDTAESRRKSG